jgi:hypothetical protein
MRLQSRKLHNVNQMGPITTTTGHINLYLYLIVVQKCGEWKMEPNPHKLHYKL